MKRITMSLIALAWIFLSDAKAATYNYEGNFFTVAAGEYNINNKVTGFITTSSPIPANSIDLDIRLLIIDWSFDDRAQTLSYPGDVMHPSYTPKFSTDGAGNIIQGDIWVSDTPVAETSGELNSYIFTQMSGGGFDFGAIGAPCSTNTGPCLSYGFPPDRGFVTGSPGVWTTVVPTYSVGGSVSGLTSSLKLQNNDTDDLDVNDNGDFTFETELEDGSAYDVTVFFDPPGQTCTVSNGSGVISSADIDNVSVNCVTREFTDSLPSGAFGSLSFTTNDPGCTFDPPPQFLAVGSVSPPPQFSVIPIDGVVQFTIDSCTAGATVTISVDYGSELPPKMRLTTKWVTHGTNCPPRLSAAS
jgi:hypothetical protein